MDFAWRFAVLDLLPDFVQQQVPENLSPDTMQKVGIGAILLALLWGYVDWPVVLSLAPAAFAVYRLVVAPSPVSNSPRPQPLLVVAPSEVSHSPGLQPTPCSISPRAQQSRVTRAMTPRAPAAQDTECWCCASTKPGSEFGLPSKQCTHENHTCKTCLWSTIRSCHLAYNAVDIQCPFCKQPMDRNDMMALYGVASDEFLEFSNVATQVSVNQELFRCAHGCESKGQLVEGGADAFSWLTCVGCKRKTCFVCNVPHHEGLSCKEFQEERKKQAMTQDAADTLKESQEAGFETKLCPGGCGRHVSRYIEDKKGECVAMRCCGKGGDHECKREQCDHKSTSGESFCGYRFCWECLQKMEEDGECEHLSDCPKHPDKLTTLDEASRQLIEELRNQR